MAEEKKGFSFLKFLLILCVLGGIGGTALLVVQKDPKQDWRTYLNTQFSVIKNKIYPAKKKVVVEAPKANPVIEKETAPDELPIKSEVFETQDEEIAPLTKEDVAEIIQEEIQPKAEEETIPNEDLGKKEIPTLPKNTPLLFLEEESGEANPNEIQPVELNEENTEVIENEVEAPQEELVENIPSPTRVRFTTSYTWKDFQTGKPCQASEIFDEENKEISNLTYSYCKTPNFDAWQMWLTTFREGKRTYLVQKTLKENTKYIKYLKAIPHLLFDVYKNNPSGNSLTDQLDQIETLIAKRQTQKAIDLIQKITDKQAQLSLNPALMEGNNLIKIQHFLNNRTAEGGEND